VQKPCSAVILCAEGREDVVKAGVRYIQNLANITEITFIDDKKDVPEETMSAVVDGAEVYIPLDELMDYKAELDRLTKEKKRLEGEVRRAAGKLSNEGFISKAPAKVVEEEKAKKIMYEEMLAKVADRLAVVEAKLK
jgi:valyl-tRNA synthetase